MSRSVTEKRDFEIGKCGIEPTVTDHDFFVTTQCCFFAYVGSDRNATLEKQRTPPREHVSAGDAERSTQGDQRYAGPERKTKWRETTSCFRPGLRLGLVLGAFCVGHAG